MNWNSAQSEIEILPPFIEFFSPKSIKPDFELLFNKHPNGISSAFVIKDCRLNAAGPVSRFNNQGP
jgi:hypothetical protein